MKKKILVLISITCMQLAYGSDTLAIRKHKHEIGIDMTNFVKTYLNISNPNYPPISYMPVYYISYRLLLGSGVNIRSGIGLSFKQSDLNAYYTSSKKLISTQRGFDFRLGIEKYYDLSKRFQTYYGIDLRTGYSYAKIDANSSGGGYFNGSEQENGVYCLAPILGIRFKINSRISLFTEASYQIVYSRGWQRRFYTPVDNTYPALPTTNSKTRDIYTIFGLPTNIVFAFNF